MYNITLNGTQDFMGRSIPVVFGGFDSGKKCISDKTIAEIHGQPVTKFRERINNNISHFMEGVDIIDAAKRIHDKDTLKLLDELEYAKQSIAQAKYIYFLSERGYSIFVKIIGGMDTWAIHDRLVSEYFADPGIPTNDTIKTPKNALIVTGTQLFMGKEIPIVLGGVGWFWPG